MKRVPSGATHMIKQPDAHTVFNSLRVKHIIYYVS